MGNRLPNTNCELRFIKVLLSFLVVTLIIVHARSCTVNCVGMYKGGQQLRNCASYCIYCIDRALVSVAPPNVEKAVHTIITLLLANSHFVCVQVPKKERVQMRTVWSFRVEPPQVIVDGCHRTSRAASVSNQREECRVL
jgi:hypothetical protein